MMVRLSESEIRALRWLAKEFPLAPYPRIGDWPTVVKALMAETGVADDKGIEAIIKRFKDLNYFEGRRFANVNFEGNITTPGEQVLRDLDAQKLETSFRRRFVSYLAAQAGPIVLQAILGAIVGAAIGWVSGTLQSAIPTGVIAAAAAGRVPAV